MWLHHLCVCLDYVRALTQTEEITQMLQLRVCVQMKKSWNRKMIYKDCDDRVTSISLNLNVLFILCSITRDTNESYRLHIQDRNDGRACFRYKVLYVSTTCWHGTSTLSQLFWKLKMEQCSCRLEELVGKLSAM